MSHAESASSHNPSPKGTEVPNGTFRKQQIVEEAELEFDTRTLGLPTISVKHRLAMRLTIQSAIEVATEHATKERDDLAAALQKLMKAVEVNMLCGIPEIKTVDDVIRGMRTVADKLHAVSRAAPCSAEAMQGNQASEQGAGFICPVCGYNTTGEQIPSARIAPTPPIVTELPKMKTPRQIVDAIERCGNFHAAKVKVVQSAIEEATRKLATDNEALRMMNNVLMTESRAAQAGEQDDAKRLVEIIMKHWPTVHKVIRSDIQVGEGAESIHSMVEAYAIAESIESRAAHASEDWTHGVGLEHHAMQHIKDKVRAAHASERKGTCQNCGANTDYDEEYCPDCEKEMTRQ
jgi:rubrerythrin